MQAFWPAFALAASIFALQGCAGINELAYGDLLARPTNTVTGVRAEFMPREGGSAEVSFNQSQGQARENSMNETSFAARASDSSSVMNDPINAPPPPLASQQAVAMPEMLEEAGRPMMLVPAPGVTTQSPVVNGMTTQPNMSSNSAVSGVVSSPIEQPSVVLSPPPSVLIENSSGLQFSPSGMQMEQETQVVSAATAQTTRMGREFIPAPISSQGLGSVSVLPGEIRLTRGQQNVLQRFSILERLVAEGLVTRNEREQRRMQNVGAILPYSHEAPAATLEREVPSGDAISARLSSLKRSLELRVITPRQHAIERGMILDALLPNEPRARATPTPPPRDVIAAAGMIGQQSVSDMKA